MITPKIKNETGVIIGPVTLAYVHLFEKYDPGVGGKSEDGKYSAVILIPKKETETVNAVKKAIKAATDKALVAKWGGRMPKDMTDPLKDGDERDDEAFAGHYFINAKSKNKPGVVDTHSNSILDEEEIYSGVKAVVSLTFFGFSAPAKKGVSCGLNNVMKTGDGERMGGRVSAASDFAGISLSDADDEDEL